MKHHVLVSRKPEIAQSTLETKMNFIVTLVGQVIQFVFNKEHGSI